MVQFSSPRAESGLQGRWTACGRYDTIARDCHSSRCDAMRSGVTALGKPNICPSRRSAARQLLRLPALRSCSPLLRSTHCTLDLRPPCSSSSRAWPLPFLPRDERNFNDVSPAWQSCTNAQENHTRSSRCNVDQRCSASSTGVFVLQRPRSSVAPGFAMGRVGLAGGGARTRKVVRRRRGGRLWSFVGSEEREGWVGTSHVSCETEAGVFTYVVPLLLA